MNFNRVSGPIMSAAQVLGLALLETSPKLRKELFARAKAICESHTMGSSKADAVATLAASAVMEYCPFAAAADMPETLLWIDGKGCAFYLSTGTPDVPAAAVSVVDSLGLGVVGRVELFRIGRAVSTGGGFSFGGRYEGCSGSGGYGISPLNLLIVYRHAAGCLRNLVRVEVGEAPCELGGVG